MSENQKSIKEFFAPKDKFPSSTTTNMQINKIINNSVAISNEYGSSNDDYIHIDLISENKKRKSYEGRDVESPQTAVIKPNIEKEGKSQTQTRKFQEIWLEKFSWLEYETDKDLMFCKLCKKHNKKNIFTKGTDKKREDVLMDHLLIEDHVNAYEESIAQKTMQKMMNIILAKSKYKYMVLLKIAHYGAREDLSFMKFETMVDLCFSIINYYIQNPNKNNEIDLKYKNTPGFNGFLSSLSYAIERFTLEKVKQSPYYAIMIDETFDISKKEQLMIYIKYLNQIDLKPETTYLKNTQITDLTGKGIFNKVIEILKEKSLDQGRLIGLGTDGASSMTGFQSGAIAYFRALNPFIQHVHCISHRLALANNYIQKKIPYLNDYVEIICDVYGFFSKSSIRNYSLKDCELEYNEPELKVIRLCPTRWLSLYNCVLNLSKIMNSVLDVFEIEMAKDKKTSNTYRPLYDEILTYKFQAFTHFLLDILAHTHSVTKLFQTEDLDISEYHREVQLILDDLRVNFMRMVPIIKISLKK